MIIDARPKDGAKRKARARRTKVIDAKTGEEVKFVGAINTLTRQITVRIPKEERTDMFEEWRTDTYEVGQYRLRDIKTGLEWPADAVVIPCIKESPQGTDCPCLDCLQD